MVRARRQSEVPPVLARVAARARPDIVFSTATEEAAYALSFDDGPDPALTPQVLEARYGGRA